MHTTSGVLSPRGKITIISRYDRGVVFAPSYRRANTEGKPVTLGLGAVADTPAMVLQVQCTGVSAGAGWNVCAGELGMAGVDTGGNAPLVLGVPVALAWRACVGAHLSVATFCTPR